MKTPKLLSRFRKLYYDRFVFRCAVLLAMALVYFLAPEQWLDAAWGLGFFARFSLLHVLWLIWMVDMILQLCPSRNYWPLGSQKFLSACFRPILGRISEEGLLRYIKKCNRDTLAIGLIWLGLILGLGALYFTGVIDRGALLLIATVFYLCDLICVLFWCPFRVWLMKNRCCTTCRIFNWDHMMMFSPLVFVPGVFTWSLCLMAFAVFLVWEITFAMHPERFWEHSNGALRCSACTDRLCGERLCRMDIPDLRQLKMRQE